MEFVDRKGSEIFLKTLEKCVKNKSKWAWLEGKDGDGQFFSDYFRKIKEPGFAWCTACQNKIKNSSSGKNEVRTYIDEYTKYYSSLSEEDQNLQTNPDAVLSSYQNILTRKVLKNTVRKRDTTKKGDTTKKEDIAKEDDTTKKEDGPSKPKRITPKRNKKSSALQKKGDTTKKEDIAKEDDTTKKEDGPSKPKRITPKRNKKSSAKPIISNGPDAGVTPSENANISLQTDSDTEQKKGNRKRSKSHSTQAGSTEESVSVIKSDVDLKPPRSKRQKKSEKQGLSNADDLLSLWSPLVKQENSTS